MVQRTLWLTLLSITLSLGTQAQDLGTYLSECTPSAPTVEIENGNMLGRGLADGAACIASSNPDTGYSVYSTPFLETYVTDTQMLFDCGVSLSPTCDGGCPTGTTCFGTLYGNADYYYFCGVECASGFFLCDNAGATNLNPNYVTYCSPTSDQCATCQSSAYLTVDGDCHQPVTVFPAVASAAANRRRSSGQGRQGRFKLRPLRASTQHCLGSNGQWELIDSDDLNSCGGCPSQGGIDCSHLPGVLRGAVACEQGRCVAYRCKSDYLLVDGTCISRDMAPAVPTSTKPIIYKRTTMVAIDKVPITDKDQLRKQPWQVVFPVKN